MRATPATGNVEIVIEIDLTRGQITGARLLTAREDQQEVLEELVIELLRPSWPEVLKRFVAKLRKTGFRNGGNGDG